MIQIVLQAKDLLLQKAVQWGARVGREGILKSKPLGLPHTVRYLLSVVSKETEIRNPRKQFTRDMCYVTSAFGSYVVMVEMEAWLFVYVTRGERLQGYVWPYSSHGCYKRRGTIQGAMRLFPATPKDSNRVCS